MGLSHLPSEVLHAIALALLNAHPPSSTMQQSGQSTGLADMARLAATCQRWRGIANPLLYTQSLVVDVAANTFTSLISTQDNVRHAAKRYRDPWLSPDPTG